MHGFLGVSIMVRIDESADEFGNARQSSAAKVGVPTVFVAVEMHTYADEQSEKYLCSAIFPRIATLPRDEKGMVRE